MFIQIEPTQDPATLRFLPGRTVLESGLESGAADFTDAEAAKRSPLAARLFEVPAVTAVSLGPDFVAVTRADDAEWQPLKPAVLGVIMEHFLEGRPVLERSLALLVETEHGAALHEPEDAAVIGVIEEMLDARIRPTLSGEGGDVAVRGFHDGTLELELLGSAFPSPLFSLKIRIENTLRHYVPEVEEVRFVQASASLQEAAPEQNLDWNDPEAVAVHELLEERINPAVAGHGGHISLIDVKDHAAYIRLEGGCQGCGMADVTLKQGVEQAIKEAVPTITAVLDVTDHGGGTNPYYQPDKGGVSPF